MRVKNLTIREILATNAKKTIEVELETEKGLVRGSVPMGTSTGSYEAVSLPSSEVINKFLIIKRYFTAQDFSSLEEVDTTLKEIDKTDNFRYIGANLALAISSAFLKAFALNEGKEVFEYLLKERPFMPKPVSNVVGGWKGQCDIQEFLLLPVHQTSFKNSIEKIAFCYKEIAKLLIEKDPNFRFARNLESAWVTSLNIEQILSLVKKVAEENLLKMGLDMAASELWDGNFYVYKNSGFKLNRTQQIGFVEDLARRYPIVYIEDPFHEDDFMAFSVLLHRLQQKLIVGDDLTVTNLKRLKKAIEHRSINGIIIKPNQVGTLSDVIKVVEEAKKNKIKCIVSHRSGETEDTLICHLAVGLGCEYIKLGIGGERTVKINELIRIEEKISK